MAQPVGTPPRPAADGWLRREALAVITVTLVVAVLGVPLGLLWRVLAPPVDLVLTGENWYPVAEEPEEYIAGDGWFILLSCAFGVLIAVLAWQIARRFRGPVTLLGLVVGSLLAALIAQWLGHRLGISGYLDQVRRASEGTLVSRPPEVRTGLGMLAQAFVAAAVYTLIAAFHYEPSLNAGPPGSTDLEPALDGDLEPTPEGDLEPAPSDDPGGAAPGQPGASGQPGAPGQNAGAAGGTDLTGPPQ